MDFRQKVSVSSDQVTQLRGILTSELPSDSPSLPMNEGRSMAGKGFSHEGLFNSGMGFALNSLLHWRAVHRAHFFDFFRRALSVEMPVPAYICR